MTHTFRPWIRAGLLSMAVLGLFFAAGCGTETRPERREGRGPRRESTPMAGQEAFFAGQVIAEVHVGTDGMPEPAPMEGRIGRDRGGPGIGPQGGRSRVSMSGAMGLGGRISGDGPPGGGARLAPGGPDEGRPRLHAAGGGRPVMIHLRFTNRGTVAVELQIRDFVSPLGNFVIRPEKITLQPGQSVEVEPMTSQLAGAFTEAVATLVLKRGDQVEKKSFPLKAATPSEKKPD